MSFECLNKSILRSKIFFVHLMFKLEEKQMKIGLALFFVTALPSILFYTCLT